MSALSTAGMEGVRHAARASGLDIQKLPLLVATGVLSGQACHLLFDDQNLGSQCHMLIPWWEQLHSSGKAQLMGPSNVKPVAQVRSQPLSRL